MMIRLLLLCTYNTLPNRRFLLFTKTVPYGTSSQSFFAKFSDLKFSVFKIFDFRFLFIELQQKINFRTLTVRNGLILHDLCVFSTVLEPYNFEFSYLLI